MYRAVSHVLARDARSSPFDSITLEHDERRIRRKMLTLAGGSGVMVDFAAAITLADGDRLVLDDGRNVAIRAADEALYEVRGRDAAHLTRLAWHLGNRHLPAELGPDRILIKRDHVIRDMLLGLGALVRELTAPFSPEHGAYAHGHADHALRNK